MKLVQGSTPPRYTVKTKSAGDAWRAHIRKKVNKAAAEKNHYEEERVTEIAAFYEHLARRLPCDAT